MYENDYYHSSDDDATLNDEYDVDFVLDVIRYLNELWEDDHDNRQSGSYLLYAQSINERIDQLTEIKERNDSGFALSYFSRQDIERLQKLTSYNVMVNFSYFSLPFGTPFPRHIL